MSERRMFSKQITDSDAFIEMPLSAQALYFHLGMQADDDGFVNSPKRIQRFLGSTDDDLKLLIAKKFLIPFESGIVVIKHWKMNNYIQKDRYKETAYLEEKSMLILNDNKSYSLAVDTPCIQNGNEMDAQYRLGKVSIDKSSSCLRGADKLINRMSEEEVEIIFKTYADADYLIDEVQADVDKKHKEIEKPFQYIVGYAEKKGWRENGED